MKLYTLPKTSKIKLYALPKTREYNTLKDALRHIKYELVNIENIQEINLNNHTKKDFPILELDSGKQISGLENILNFIKKYENYINQQQR